MITILFIDRLVASSEVQKNKRSIAFVKATLADTCYNLVWHLRAPENWRARDCRWKDYFIDVRNARKDALNRLETVLGRYSNLMDSDLRNELFDIATLLNSGSWDMPFLPIDGATDLMRLNFIAEYVVGVIHSSLELLKKHKLWETSEWVLRTKVGEPPQIDRSSFNSAGIARRLVECEQWLKQSIEFKDEIWKLEFSTSK